MSYENHLYLLIKGYKVWWVSGYRYYATIFGTSFILFIFFNVFYDCNSHLWCFANLLCRCWDGVGEGVREGIRLWARERKQSNVFFFFSTIFFFGRMNMEMAGDYSHFAVDKGKEWNEYQYHRIVHTITN